MDQDKLALSIITASILTGVIISPQVDVNSVWQGLQSNPEKETNEHHEEMHESENRSLQLSSDHSHALFYVKINGSEYNFSKKKFQLRSRYVHLENFKPHIVHTHSKNVTWKYFLKTIDVSLNHSKNETCIKIMEDKECGNGSVILNGEEIYNLDKEISQGDNLAIMIPEDENQSQMYMEEDLPGDYRPDGDMRRIKYRAERIEARTVSATT